MLWRTVIGLSVAVAALVSVVMAAGAPAAAAPPNRTPNPNEIFNGYVLGTFTNGRVASPQ